MTRAADWLREQAEQRQKALPARVYDLDAHRAAKDAVWEDDDDCGCNADDGDHMICGMCGQHREDLDENDLCPGCWDQAFDPIPPARRYMDITGTYDECPECKKHIKPGFYEDHYKEAHR